MIQNNNLNTDSDVKFWARILSQSLASLNSILEKLGAIFPWIRHWLNRPIILPHCRSNWWHMGSTGDQKSAMQIVGYWYVTNPTDQPISILNVYIKKPKNQGHVSLKDVHSEYHGDYPIPPRATTDLHADFWICPPFCKEGKDFKTDIIFVDQYGQKRILKNVEFKSDKKKRSIPIKLTEEAIYKLQNQIEKKVAATLKDEISRYQKYGRQSGELGSICALCKGRQIKSIYQDSWTSSQSGERQEILNDSQGATVQSENGDALVKLFKSFKDEEDRELFVQVLFTRFSRDKEYYCVSYIILYVLFRVGRLTNALNIAKASLSKKKDPPYIFWQRKSENRLLEPYQRYGFSDLLGLINGMLRYEHRSFTNEELDSIEEFIDDLDEHTFRIKEKINSIRSFRVSES